MDKRFRILAVDDEYVNTQLLKSVLGEEYDILTALNGHDAIDQIEQYIPDLILLDVMMPDISGFEVCKIIKADERFADIPIIFLTAMDSEEDQLQGLELGGIDYLTKPINFALLKMRVRNHLAMKEQRDQLVLQKEKLDQMLAEQELQSEQLREAHETLRAEQSFSKSLLDSLPGIFYLYSYPELRMVQCNKLHESHFGYQPGELKGRQVTEWYPAEARDVALKVIDGVMENGHGSLEASVLAKDGSLLPFYFTAISFESHGQRYLMGTGTDITERKRIEESLRVIEKKQAKMIANIGDVIVIIDQNGINRYKSPNIEKWFGWKPEELVGANAFDNVHPDDLAVAQKFVGTLMSEPGSTGSTECRYRCKDGSYKWIEITLINLLDDPDILGILGDYHDITERRRFEDEKRALEQQLQQTQKLESLGVLAGGIAHDFNNILAIIVGYCGLTKMDYESAEKNIPEIEKAAERAAALCRQMLAYAGKATLTQSLVNMWMLVDEMVSMLKATINPNVTILSDLPANIPFITGDASQLRQVVMNLIINASEAIGEEQGNVHVSLAKRAVIAGQVESDHLGNIIMPGTYVCIEVADSGCGMDDETKQRIFEPFYTTKFSGRGLGMSAVLGIITAHKGALQLASQPGQGSTFKLYLPVQTGEPLGESSLQQASSAPWTGSGTILLVEDEEQVMLIARTMLQALGFTIIEACNGREALKLYQKNAAEITLVVTDMGMPVMDGYALFRELKMLNPKLPIIISSGYGETVVTSRIPREEIAGLVSKPYRFDQLREVLKVVVEVAT